MRTLSENIVFMHIPKAGGTSVRELISKFVPKEQVYPEEKLHHFPEFKKLQACGNYLFMSHLGYSFALQANAKKICLLRDPIDRLLSVYSYYLDPGVGLPLIEKKYFGNLSFEEFVLNESPVIRMNIENSQAWQIGYGYSVSERSEFERLAFADISSTAAGNLKKIDVLGVVERFDSFLDKLGEFFEVAIDDKSGIHNKSKSRVKWGDLSKSEKNLAEKAVEIDRMVYETALTVI